MSESKKAYINPLGFREYDARWLYKKEINLEGIKLVGKGFGTQVIKKNKRKNNVFRPNYKIACGKIPKSRPFKQQFKLKYTHKWCENSEEITFFVHQKYPCDSVDPMPTNTEFIGVYTYYKTHRI